MLPERAVRIFLIGIDQAILPLTKRLVEEGGFPALKRLLQEGASSQVIPSFPAWTPTNWATIATGAETGTHGVFCWQATMPTGQVLPSFHSYSVNAETIWEAAGKAGLRSAAIHFPASMPERSGGALMVDGDGSPGYGESRFEIAPSKCYTNLGLPNAEKIRLVRAEGWKNIPGSCTDPLEAKVTVIPKFKGVEKTWYLLTFRCAGQGYNRIRICREKDFESRVSEAGAGEWSEWLYERFTVEGRDCPGTLRFKCVEIARDASRLRLYRSQVMPVKDFTFPDELGEELVGRIGPYQEHVSEYSYLLGWTDYDTCLQEAEYQAQWFARAMLYLAEQKEVSLLYSHWHFLDDVNHHHLARIDPSWPGYDQGRAADHWQVIRKAYAIIDRYVQTVLQGLTEKDCLVLISDHGNLPIYRQVWLEKYLSDKGFLVRKDPSCPLSVLDERWDDNIDWSRTKAYLKGGPGIDFSIYVNAEGKRKEAIQEELIRELRTWIDPQTGKTPVAVALKKRDAALLGCWGENVGDVVFMLEPEYTLSFLMSSRAPKGEGWILPHAGITAAAHGVQLPTCQTEVSSHLAMLIMRGPGIKRRYARDADRLGYIRMNQIVPTLSHLLNIPPPAQSQGAVICDFLTGHETSRNRPTQRVEDRELDGRVIVQKGMHDYSILEGGTKAGRHYLQQLSRASWTDIPADS